MNKKLFGSAWPFHCRPCALDCEFEGGSAGIGAAVGLLGGAVIGDHMQARQKQDEEVHRRMTAQQAGIDRQQRELNQLKAQQTR